MANVLWMIEDKGGRKLSAQIEPTRNQSLGMFKNFAGPDMVPCQKQNRKLVATRIWALGAFVNRLELELIGT